MHFYIPQFVTEVLDVLKKADVDAYLVGGCVRDTILEREVHDYDVAVCASPDKVQEVLSSFKCIETGKRFGTITVISNGEPIEITSARKDGTYVDGRRPNNVIYTNDIREDLARRDFTVNAMAYSREHGLIDLYNGQEDAQFGIIRAVGDAETRFQEDGLRIMRALRFSSVLGFKIEEKTANALHTVTKSGRLSSVSSERIYSELVKMLLGDNVAEILIDYSDVITTVIPELKTAIDFEQKNPYHIYTVYDHTAYSVGYAIKDKDIRLTMLLHDVAKPYVMTEDENGIRHFKTHAEKGATMAREILTRLKVDSATINKVEKLILYHDLRPNGDKKAVKRYLSKVGVDVAEDLLSVRRADLLAHNPAFRGNLSEIDASKMMMQIIIKENACIKVSDLEITGTDLIQMGFSKGPEIGEVLKLLLNDVIEETVPNDKSLLLQAAEKYKKIAK